MAEQLNMLNVLMAWQPSDAIIGWRANKPVRRDAFLAAVHAWHSLLAAAAGQKFGLYFSDSIQFAAALFGAWQAGKTVYLPADTLPATCIALRGTVDGFIGEFPEEWAPYIQPATTGQAPVASGSHALDPDFVGLVVHTSGSTGAAQAIPKKLSQLASEVATLEALFGNRLQSADIVATVSHQHIYGLLFKVLWPLTAGRAIHALSIAYPEELAEKMAQRSCVLISSPAHLKRLPATPIWDKPASQLRAVFSSGGPLTLDIAQSSAKLLGQTSIEIYGSSETGGIAWRQRNDQPRELDESWTPFPTVAWRVSQDDGVLEVSSPHLSDANWFALSDRALAVRADRFQLHGRVDRIVKIEEKRVSLDTIEKQLQASPLVDDARVLVVDGLRQRVAAFVVLSAQGRRNLAEQGKLALNRILREQLSGFVEAVALPRSWRYLDALPLNAQGKTTHAALTALLDDIGRPKLPRLCLLYQDEQRVVLELTAPQDLYYFDGHFTQAPILAGVVQIDWAIAYGRQHFDLPPVFRGIHALKFQRVITPEMPVELELTFQPQKSSLTFNYHSADGQHSSGRVQFGSSDV